MNSIVMSLGTDHHRFDRLVGYVEDWLRGAVDHDYELILQHGSSAPSSLAVRNVVSLPPDELRQLYERADIIVTQVGPGTIADVNAAGRRPIIVPRDPSLDEVVDRHQFAYGELMAASNLAWHATDRDGVWSLLDRMAEDPGMTALTADRPDPDQAARKFATVADRVAARRPGMLSWRRMRDMLR